MKKVSIKTVDGSRNEYTIEDGDDFDIDRFAYYYGNAEYIGIPINNNGIKYFNKAAIVSITVTEL
jgi:hypothetical protein